MEKSVARQKKVGLVLLWSIMVMKEETSSVMVLDFVSQLPKDYTATIYRITESSESNTSLVMIEN